MFDLAVLKGRKTYVAGIVAIIGAVAAVLVGDMTIVQAAQIVVPAVLGMTVRHGIG